MFKEKVEMFKEKFPYLHLISVAEDMCDGLDARSGHKPLYEDMG